MMTIIFRKSCFLFMREPCNLPKLVGITGFRQFCGKGAGILKQYPISLETGFKANGNGNVGLAPAGISNHDDVLVLIYEFAGRQLLDKHPDML